MHNTHISRRRFAVVTGTAALAQRGIGAEPLTAEIVVRRIQTELGGEWSMTSSDGFKAGDPLTVVKGIATTAMATLDVLKQAVKANANLVLTYEPTFYGRAEDRVSSDDPVVKAKREWIGKNGIVVFRMRDHWLASKQNEMAAALAGALGWSNRRSQSDDTIYEIPAATAEETVALIRNRLKLRGGLRAVGDRRAAIRRVLLHPGPMPPAVMLQRYTEVDMIVAGEVREWESTHYAADMFTAGARRALVTVGRVVSEEPGMRACAEWLKALVKEVPAMWIGVGDPYWRPAR